MSKYGTGMRSCCDSLLRGNRPHIIGCEQYTPQDSQTITADGASHTYHMRWIAGARPPVHPNPMEGSQTFLDFDAAVARMNAMADDAKFISLTRITTSTEDVSEMAKTHLRAALNQGQG